MPPPPPERGFAGDLPLGPLADFDEGPDASRLDDSFDGFILGFSSRSLSRSPLAITISVPSVMLLYERQACDAVASRCLLPYSHRAPS